MGLSDSAELSRLAESFQNDLPKIATRCAVFAKTDLIHCQQQGYSIEAISAGLCRGLAHNITDTLVKGIKLREPVVVVGGQDAKLTVMKDGQVTFSVMNYVCAAGTGSFIEEQVKRLNVPLDKCADQVICIPSPLTSDRCTVFMERDLNHFMSQGYSRQELLAAVLHSVRDNYLSKVAHLKNIALQIN